jgi:3-phosphoshikimate 1-carboxyvinyltransferase
MGAMVRGQGERCTPPITIHGGPLQPLIYRSPVASAQVKSAVLLAGLYAAGRTTVIEPSRSRDHTERMLPVFGVPVEVDGASVTVAGPAALQAAEVIVPPDLSSAAFLLVAGLLAPGSEVRAEQVLLNPTRTGVLEALRAMGADLQIEREQAAGGETVGDVLARASALRGTEIAGEIVPRLIDEVPVLAVAATQAEGRTIIREARELRVKESDRLAATARMLQAMGGQVRELADGLIIDGPTPLHGAEIDAEWDHRIAMSAAVAAQVATGQTVIHGASSVGTSFPGFFELLLQLRA